MTLAELLVSIAVLGIVAVAMSTLAHSVQQGYEYSEGHATMAQHARVALDRMTRIVHEATASEQFPGFIVVEEQVGGWRLPEVLVVWHPEGEPVDPTGLPRFNELILFCPGKAATNQLVELRAPDDTRIVPAVGDLAAWLAEVRAIRASADTNAVTLTDLLRTAWIGTGPSAGSRGMVRFESRLRPSASEWASYRAGTLAWSDLAWPQNFSSATSGMRQAWVRVEVQLMPGEAWIASDPAGQRAVPFFGSAALYYPLRK